MIIQTCNRCKDETKFNDTDFPHGSVELTEYYQSKNPEKTHYHLCEDCISDFNEFMTAKTEVRQ